MREWRLKLIPAVCKITGEPARRTSVLVCIAFVGVFTTTSSHAQTQRDLAYRLQALYLLNFLEFTEWPDSVFADRQSPIVVGVLGTDPFAKVLEEVVQGETIGDRPISVVRFESIDHAKRCHALFFCMSERESCSSHLSRVKGWPTLTVSEIDGFTYLGGCISFYVEKGKLRFEINMQALKESGVTMSSRLLRFARIVNSK